MSHKVRTTRRAIAAAKPQKPPTFHEQIETGGVDRAMLALAIEKERLDLGIGLFSETDLYMAADRVATSVYASYADLKYAYHAALCDVQKATGYDLFNQLEGAGAAVDRRLVLAAYFLGVHVGRATGGAR